MVKADRKPNNPKPSYAPDGVLSADWRLVRPCPEGGRVKAWGTWWASPALAPFVGEWVFVEAGEYWVTWIRVFSWPFKADCHICDIGDK